MSEKGLVKNKHYKVVALGVDKRVRELYFSGHNPTSILRILRREGIKEDELSWEAVRNYIIREDLLNKFLSRQDELMKYEAAKAKAKLDEKIQYLWKKSKSMLLRYERKAKEAWKKGDKKTAFKCDYHIERIMDMLIKQIHEMIGKYKEDKGMTFIGEQQVNQAIVVKWQSELEREKRKQQVFLDE